MQEHCFMLYLNFACDVKPTTVEQYLLMTCSTAEKYRNVGLINYSNKNANLSYSASCDDLSYYGR